MTQLEQDLYILIYSFDPKCKTFVFYRILFNSDHVRYVGNKVLPGSSTKSQRDILKKIFITDFLYPLKPHHFKENLQQTQMVKPSFI